jgi:hypothetical protein
MKDRLSDCEYPERINQQSIIEMVQNKDGLKLGYTGIYLINAKNAD